jgi:hypothetical protein
VTATRNRRRWIASLLVSLLVLALLVAACAEQTGGTEGTGATGTTATGATGPTAPSPTPSEEPTESPPAQPNLEDGRHFGYVRSVDAAGSTLVLDLAEFYSGDEANEIAAERGDEVPVPNDYYIVNDNPRLRTLVLSPDVELVLLDWNRCCDETFGPTVEQFAAAVADGEPVEIDGHLTYGAQSQYWLTVAGGVVTAIEEQYLP